MAGGVLLLLFIVVGVILPHFSPYDPRSWNAVPRNLPPSQVHLLGTTSLGQDTFWLLTFAVQNLACKFANRCPFVQPVCRINKPPPVQIPGEREVLCFKPVDYALGRTTLNRKSEKVKQCANYEPTGDDDGSLF